MNVYKPLIIFNIMHSITIMTDGCTNFRKFLVEGTKPNLKKIKEYVDRSLMLVTALAPVIGYDKASKIAHHAMDNDLTLKAAALDLGYVTRGGIRSRRRSGQDGQTVCRHRNVGAGSERNVSDQPAPGAAEVEEVAHLSLQVGRLLLLNGGDTEAVETAVMRFATAFACDAHLMVTYEALLLTIVAGDHFRTKIGHRVPAMNVGMTAVSAVNRLVEEAESGRLGLAAARAELDRIEHRPPEYGRWLVIASLGLTAASLSRLFGGDWPTFAVTWLGGAAGTWLRLELGRRHVNLITVPFAAASLSGIIGGIAVLLGASGTPSLCLVAPGMIIVPGVPLINGVQDMIRNHMTLAISRLAFAGAGHRRDRLRSVCRHGADRRDNPGGSADARDRSAGRCGILGHGCARLCLPVQRAGARGLGVRPLRCRQPHNANALRPSGDRHHRRHTYRCAGGGLPGASLRAAV